MHTIKLILRTFTPEEKKTFTIAFTLFLIATLSYIGVTINTRGALVPISGGTYVEGVIGQPIMINPILSPNQVDRDISALIYSPLFSLLSDWRIGNDGKEYTIKLKEGLTWDDGKPLTSDDVLFTIQTIQNTNARSPLSKDWQGITVERVSQLQIRFTLPAPYVFFTENLKRTRIIPQHIFGAIPVENVRLSGYNLEPVGSGPYKFSQYSKRKDGFITEYILIPNELFSGHAPYITQFSFKFYPTQDELLKDFRLRRVNGFGSALPLGTEIQNLPRVTKEEVPMPRYYSIFLNAINNPALKDDNLRFALSLAIDKKKIINDVFKGSASTIESPLFSSLITFESQDALGTSTTPVWPTTSSTSSYDPVEAARIISQLKTKDIKLSLVVPDVPFLTKAADIIKENWLASGIGEVTIYKENADTITEEYVKTRNYELLLFGNIFENPADLFPFWHSSQRFYPGLNLSLYQHLEADRIMEMVRQKNEVEAQTQGLLTLDAIIREDNPALFLFSLPYFYAHEARLSGFAPAFITAPEDRFQNVEAWSVAQARILQ